MFSPLTTVVALALLVLSVLLVLSHLRTWRAARATHAGDDAEAEFEVAFARRQLQRRLQASTMIGLVGVAMLVGQFLPRDWPQAIAFLWSGILLVVLWIMLLALADALASYQHYGRVRRRDLAEQAKLHAELRRLRAHHGNGHDNTQQEESGNRDRT